MQLAQIKWPCTIMTSPFSRFPGVSNALPFIKKRTQKCSSVQIVCTTTSRAATLLADPDLACARIEIRRSVSALVIMLTTLISIVWGISRVVACGRMLFEVMNPDSNPSLPEPDPVLWSEADLTKTIILVIYERTNDKVTSQELGKCLFVPAAGSSVALLACHAQ